jgi:hypothetical protein
MNVAVKTKSGDFYVPFIESQRPHFFCRFATFDGQSFEINHCWMIHILQLPQGHLRVSRARNEETVIQPFKVEHPVTVRTLKVHNLAPKW